MTDFSVQASPSPSNKAPWIIATIAASALAVQNMQTLHDAWREYVGWFCAFSIESEPVTAYSGGRDVPFVRNPECHPHQYLVKIVPTKWPRKLDVGSLKFEPAERTGRYGNGDVVNPNAAMSDTDPEVGWFVKSQSPDLIEAIVYSRTGACESKRSITGRFQVTEHNYLGW